MSIRVSFNFIEVIRPRCNADMQFSGRYSYPRDLPGFVRLNNYKPRTHSVVCLWCRTVLAKKSGMVGNKPTLYQNWKTSKPAGYTD